MSLLNVLYKHLVIPGLDRKRYAGLAVNMAEFRHWEQLSADEVHELQMQQLRRLLQHAYDTTGFYKKRMDEAGVRPSQVKGTDDLLRIPPLTRSDIRENRERIRSSRFDARTLVVSATGGTTDIPVPFEADTGSIRKKLAVQARFNEWAGLEPGDKIFYLWGARADYPENPSWRWRIYDRHLLRRVWAPPSLMNEQVFEKHHALLEDFRPTAIIAYPSALTLFCEYLRSTGKHHFSPKTIICTAESLSSEQRAVIESTFGRKVFEHYGSREFGMLGAECEAHSGIHLHPANALVEFLPISDAEPAIRELFVTDLFNFAMPLIRYKVNDCAEPEVDPCACGRSFPKVRQILGRTTDVLRFRGGNLVPGVILARRVAKACPKVRKWQIVQHSYDLCELRYVPAEAMSQDDIRMMRGNLDEIFPARVQWQLTPVDEIPRERSGKTRMCISRVDTAPPEPVSSNAGSA